MIPSSISTSLFVEGSHGVDLKKTVVKLLVAIYLLLIPSIAILYLKGDALLMIIGRNYSENGTEILKLMAFASLFAAVTLTYLSIKRIQNDMKALIVLSGAICTMLIGFGYFLHSSLD